MNTIFTKKYSGKIKRLLSEGQFSPSELPEVFLDTEKTTNIKTDNLEVEYPAKVFNIINKKDSVEVTSNTLALRITDKIIDGKPFFKKLLKKPNPEDLNKLTVEYVLLEDIVYLNTDKTYLKLGDNLYTVVPVIGLDVWNKNSNVNIRKLKDRFKITIKTSDKLIIELINTSILSPTIYNNWLIFTDCVHQFNNKNFSYLYSHSFEYFTKTELHEKTSQLLLRDIPIGDITVDDISDRYFKVSYTTYRSNLMVNNTTDTSLYLNIVFDKDVPNLVSSQKSSKTDLLTITKSKTIIKEIVENSYLLTPLYRSKPEAIYFVWESSSKYAKSSNVPLGCERVILDFKKLVARQSPTISVHEQPLLENLYDPTTTYNTTIYNGNSNVDKLLDLLQKVT